MERYPPQINRFDLQFEPRFPGKLCFLGLLSEKMTGTKFVLHRTVIKLQLSRIN